MRSNRVKDPTKLRAGTSIFVPMVSAPLAPQSTAVGALAWPLRGSLTGKFGPRGKRSRHRGIDIDGQAGDEINAAASGTVTEAGIRGKYGRMVIIDHGDGLTTLYAHVRKLMVRVGDRVERGDPIAEVGRSGNATGSHLHFEVHRNSRPVDPIGYLQTDALVSSLPSPHMNLTQASPATEPKLKGLHPHSSMDSGHLSGKSGITTDSGQPATLDFYETSRTTSVYKKPSVSSTKLATIPEGTNVNVVGFTGEWLEIRSIHGKPPGFIRRADTRIVKQSGVVIVPRDEVTG
jgi:hypothetical protein